MATVNDTESKKVEMPATEQVPPPTEGAEVEDKTDDDDDKKSEVFEKEDPAQDLTEDELPDEPKEEEESEEEEPIIGSLDKPIEILTDKRDRKSRELMVIQHNKKTPKERPDYSLAQGTMISKIPYAKYQIEGEPDEDLLTLHQLMYRVQPKYINWTKSGVLKFKGFPFDEKSPYYRAHQRLCEHLTKAGVRYINELLGVAWKDRTKEEMIADLFQFLCSPKDLGLEVPAPKPPKAKKYKPRTGPPKGYVLVRAGVSDDEDDEAESTDEEDADGRRKSRRVSLKVVEKKSAKKTPKKTPAKQTPAKKVGRPAKKVGRPASGSAKGSSSRRGTPSRSNKATPVASRSSGRPSRAAKRGVPQEVSDSSDEDEVLVKTKKAKKSPAKKDTSKKPPTKAELKRTINDLLKGADLSAVTMKKILNQVYDKYSDHDLSSYNDFLKKAVKECL